MFQTTAQMTSTRAARAAAQMPSYRFKILRPVVIDRATGERRTHKAVYVTSPAGQTYICGDNHRCGCPDFTRRAANALPGQPVPPCKHLLMSYAHLRQEKAARMVETAFPVVLPAVRASAVMPILPAEWEDAGSGDAFPEPVLEAQDRPTAADEDRAARARLLELARARTNRTRHLDWPDDDVELDRR